MGAITLRCFISSSWDREIQLLVQIYVGYGTQQNTSTNNCIWWFTSKKKLCTSANGRQGPWMNWGECMLCYHCAYTNVEGMPRVAMRIQATIVQQGADVCAEPEPWQGSPSWHQTQEFIHTPLLKGHAKVTPGQWSCLNDNYCLCFSVLVHF